MKISLVVPCYNEQDAAPLFLQTVTPIVESTGLDFEIVFVDDGSSDATASVPIHAHPLTMLFCYLGCDLRS